MSKVRLLSPRADYAGREANFGPGNPTKFQPGISGNPGGKPVGTRNRLKTSFFDALCEDFEAHGAEAIRACRVRTPARYVAIAASLVAGMVETDRPLGELSTDELREQIIHVRGELARAERERRDREPPVPGGARAGAVGAAGKGRDRGLQAVPEAKAVPRRRQG